MNEFIQFLIKNWQLPLAFVAILVAILVTEFKENRSGSDSVSPEELTKLMNRDKAVVFDVRDKESYQSGHIVDAIILGVDDLESSLKKFKKEKQKPCIIVDADGSSFGKVAKRLEDFGFERVLGLKGGIKAWKDAGMPLVKEMNHA